MKRSAEQTRQRLRGPLARPCCGQAGSSLRQGSGGFLATPHTHTPVLSVSMATGAAPLVGVATLHRHGAEIGGDKAAVQAREQREERIHRPQLPQPLHSAAQRRQVRRRRVAVATIRQTMRVSESLNHVGAACFFNVQIKRRARHNNRRVCVSVTNGCCFCAASCTQTSWASPNWPARARRRSWWPCSTSSSAGSMTSPR